MVVSAVEQTGEVPGFVDRLGERVVVPQPSGAFLELLHFRHELSSAPFFETALKARLKRLSNFRHPSYARATRIQREASHEGRLALVSGYVSGRRLADIILLARRGRLRPKTSAVLSLTRQLMTGVALLHDYAPDVFHGALGPERLVISADGRLVITEYVLGEAVERGVAEWGPTTLWREYRVPALADATVPRFGRRLDLVQIGLVALALLVGRPLTDAEYPAGLGGALDLALEVNGEGEEAPLGPALRDWLSRMLFADGENAFRTLLEAQKAFGRMVEEDGRYGVSSLAVESFLAQCDEAAVLPGVPPEVDSGAAPASAVATDTPAPAAADALAAAPGTAAASPTPHPSEDVGDQYWPVVVGSDTIGTLFETFKPAGPVRESHVVSIPDAGAAERLSARDVLAAHEPQEGQERRERQEPPAIAGHDVPAPGAASEVPHVTGSVAMPDATPADGTPVAGFNWLDDDEQDSSARRLRESLFEPPPPAPDIAPPLADEPLIDDPPTVAAHAWTPSFAPSFGGSPDVVVVETPPIAPPPAALPQLAAAPATATHPPDAPAPAAAAARRAPAVLSYEEIHRPAAKPRRGLAIAAAVLLVVAVAAAGVGFAVWSARSSDGKSAVASSGASAGARTAGEAGGVRITTQPPGGKITIDGSVRGTAPLQVTLSPGSHLLTAESEWGSVDQEIRVEAGKVAPLAVTIAGWIKFVAPVELVVSEGGRSYGTTGKGQLMVPSGRHHFDLVNQAVAVRLTQFVDVPGGQVKTVPVDLPAGTINLTSDQPAEVLLDGHPIGRTPMMSVSTPLGQHEVVFRSEKYGEVSYTVNVTLAAPVRLTVSFLKR